MHRGWAQAPQFEEEEAPQRTIRGGRRGTRNKPPWAESWSDVNKVGLQQPGSAAARQQQQQQQQQQHQVETIEEEASSRASSPAKSPFLQGLPGFLEQADVPLSQQQGSGSAGRRHGSRAARGSHQDELGGIQQQQQQQQQRTQLRPLDLPLGGSQPHPSSPPISNSQYNLWMAQAADERAGTSANMGLGGRRSDGAGTPPNGRRMLFERGVPAAAGTNAFGFGAGAPSDPMTYNMQAALDKDGVPNMGDVTVQGDGGAPTNDWRIGAQRTHTQGGSRYSPMPSQNGTPGGGKRGGPDKPGAAVKMGRRQAWLKFLAYEGCFQLCLEQAMGSGSELGAGFLREGCRELKTALGFEQLLLTPMGGGAGMYMGTGAETAIYWDDKEEGGVTAAVETRIETLPAPPPITAPPPKKQPLSLPPQPMKQVPLARASNTSLATTVSRRGGPFIEARPARVVGCALLGEGYGRELHLVMYPSGRPDRRDNGTWTLIHSDGSAHQVEPLMLDPEAGLNDTVTVELCDRVKGPLAQGTVQMTELHKLANQPDLMFDEPSGGQGFLKSILPCLRKGARTNSMAWVKLVDDAGRATGHAVLTARLVAGLGGMEVQGFLGPPSVSSVPVIEELNTLSINQPDPDPEPVALPPMPAAPTHPITTTVVRLEAHGKPKQPATSAGFLHVTAVQVYDELLNAALRATGCGPRKLSLEGPWRWLLHEFGMAYGVRDNYARLSFLRWVVRPENATITSDCFSVLLRELGPLKAAQAANGLSSGELGVLAQVCSRVEELLRTCFENYFMLSEEAESGMMDGALSVRAGIPAVLAPAVGLFSLLRDAANPGDQLWLTSLFTLAARKRYQGLLHAVELQRSSSPRGGTGPRKAATHADAPEAKAAYSRMEELVKAVVSELRQDQAIQDSGVLPAFVRLPEVTALSYVRDIIKHLQRVLDKYPPPAPSEPAVQLVEAVGRLQDHVIRHGYADAAARISSRDIFSHFVQQWIGNSSAGLRATCAALEAQAPAAAAWQDMGLEGKQRVALLVEEMLSATEHEMGRYARIIQYWPTYGQDLEKCVTGALRDTTMAVSRQCGLVQVKEGAGGPAPDAGPGAIQPLYQRERSSPAGRGRTAWRWVQPSDRQQPVPAAFRGAPGILQHGITPMQALLLNSLRRLLAASPQMEHSLMRWCSGPSAQSTNNFAPSDEGSERIARDAPNLGAQFAQLVKELRSEYFAAITLCAERLAAELARTPGLSVVLVLRKGGLHGAPQQITATLTAVLEQLERLLQWLSTTLDTRVFVALARGLWDLTAKDVLEYAEDLREGRGGEAHAWRGRQNAHASLLLLDRFFKSVLTSSMGNDLQDKDLNLPQHADRAHKLLADNMATVQMSYDVY